MADAKYKSDEGLTVEEAELETLEGETLLVETEGVKVEPVLSPEQIASRQLAHDIKVANFLSGGKF